VRIVFAVMGCLMLTAAISVSGLDPNTSQFWVMGALLFGSHVSMTLLGVHDG
jgi:hypothetical protein